MDVKIIKIIKEKALEFKIDADLVQAFVTVESSGNPLAFRYEANFYKTYIQPLMVRDPSITPSDGIRRATSWGLLQVMGQVARERGFLDTFETLLVPDVGLHWGLKHLRHFIEKYPNSLDDAIAAYNAGSPRKNKDGTYKNQLYVDKIHKYLKQIKEAS